MEINRSKWFLPMFAVALGVVMGVAQWIGGHPGAGAASFGIMVAFGALILVGGSRSETIRGLRGDGRDERFRQIDVTATVGDRAARARLSEARRLRSVAFLRGPSGPAF